MSASAVLFRAARAAALRFPGPSLWIAALAGDIAWLLRRQARRRVIRNLLPVCDGDRDRARRFSRSVFRSAAIYYVELAAIAGLRPRAFLRNHIELVNAQHLAEVDGERSFLVVGAHMGNAEVALQGLLGRGRAFVAIVEALEDRDLASELLAARAAAGGTFVEASPGGLRQAVRHLRQGTVLALMGDRDLQGDGICLPVFGRRAKLPRLPWEIARRTGYPVLPAFCQRLPSGRYRVILGEPIRAGASDDRERDIARAASRWVADFEACARSDPGQWTVLEDFWANHRCPESGDA